MMQIKLIKWVDTTQTRDKDLNTFKGGMVAPMNSVGFVLDENETAITLVRDVVLGDPEFYRKIISIPKSAITDHTTMSESDIIQGISLIEWQDYVFNYEVGLLTKEEVLKKINSRRVKSIGLTLFQDEEKISISGDIDTFKNVAKYVQTIPKKLGIKVYEHKDLRKAIERENNMELQDEIKKKLNTLLVKFLKSMTKFSPSSKKRGKRQ